MKITQTPAFSPVIVTLESQAEVDALYLVARHSWIVAALPALSPVDDLIMEFVSQEAKGTAQFTDFDKSIGNKYRAERVL